MEAFSSKTDLARRTDWSNEHRNEKQRFLMDCFGVKTIFEAFSNLGDLVQGHLWEGFRRAIKKHHLKKPLSELKHINSPGYDIKVGDKTIETKNYATTSYLHEDNIPETDGLLITDVSNIHKAARIKLKKQGTTIIYDHVQVVPPFYYAKYPDENTIPAGPDARRLYLKIAEQFLVAFGYLPERLVYDSGLPTGDTPTQDYLVDNFDLDYALTKDDQLSEAYLASLFLTAFDLQPDSTLQLVLDDEQLNGLWGLPSDT